MMPLFVVGFLAAIGLASTGWLAPSVLGAAKIGQQVLLTAALVGLGAGIHVAHAAAHRRAGARARPAVLGAGGHGRLRWGCVWSGRDAGAVRDASAES